MRKFALLMPLVFAVLFFSALVTQAVQPMSFYVAPNGRDSWSGRLAAPNARKTDGPFATIFRAQVTVRAMRIAGVLTIPVNIQLRQGQYFLREPLVFTSDDSGTTQAPITYTTYQNESVIISGGQRITGWKMDTVHGQACWVAELPEVAAGKWNFTQLFVNGTRAPRTRLPKEGLYRFTGLPEKSGNAWGNEGPLNAEFMPGDLKAWSHLDDVEIVPLQNWVEKHMRPIKVDEEKHLVTFAARGTSFIDEKGQFSRYYVSNVFEALDTPGQWYLDRTAGKLYYLPRPGEQPDKVEIIAPRLQTLVEFQGSAEHKVEYITLEHLTFQHAEWSLPKTYTGDVQAAYSVPAAIQLTGALHCALFRCEIAHIAQYAIAIQNQSSDNRIIACNLHDLGAGGVKVEAGSRHSEIADCTIFDAGLIHHQAIGVLVRDSGYNRVQHNLIHDLYYTGISCGWSWGYGLTATIDNRIEYNHIYNIGKKLLSDMGGIYTLGLQPGGIIRGNVIHDVENYAYGGWGIYNDEGSSGFLVEKNLVYRTNTAGYNMHYGQDELIRNNIFAFAKEDNIGRGRQEQHRSFIFEHNIVVWDHQHPMFEGYANSPYWDHIALNNNLYWNTAGTGVNFCGKSLGQWQEMQRDAGSLEADPQFVDAAKDDYRLKPTSPAFAIGFKPFDSSLAGPRKLTSQHLSAWPTIKEDAIPIIVTHLVIANPGDFTATHPSGVVRLTLKNVGATIATGTIKVVPEVPGSARIGGGTTVIFKLQPDEILQRDFPVDDLAFHDATEIAIITIPTGDALIPTCLYLQNPKPATK